MRGTFVSFPTLTTLVSAWLPAGTPCSPKNEPANAKTYLVATETGLCAIAQACSRERRRLKGTEQIALRVGKVLNKFKMQKHFVIEITDDSFHFYRNEASIQEEAALDGIYILRTTIAQDELDPAGVISAYKELKGVEWDFRSMKAIDIDLRPIHHRLEDRVKAHALICFLATYITFYLRKALAPLTFTDTDPTIPSDPVVPATRSLSARKKDARKKNSQGEPVRSFRELLEHLGTLSRDTLRIAGENGVTFDLVATPTPTQRRVFELLGSSVPRTIS